jgi:hypothetical protein
MEEKAKTNTNYVLKCLCKAFVTYYLNQRRRGFYETKKSIGVVTYCMHEYFINGM